MSNHQHQISEAENQAHIDAIRSNPFTLTNLILGIGLLVGSALLLDLISTVKSTHDVILEHGVILKVMQQDVSSLKEASTETIKRTEFDKFRDEVAQKIGSFDGVISPSKTTR
jgi:uncharacterized protein YoxC